MSEESGSALLRVPRSDSAKHDLLSALPPGWEYLLFAGELNAGVARHEVRWRDYTLRYTGMSGPKVSLRDLPNELGNRATVSSSIVQTMMVLFDSDAHIKAFGAPGEPGDRALIEHLALRLTDSYGQLIDWGLSVLALVVDDPGKPSTKTLASMVEQPLLEFREWVASFATDLEAGLQQLASSPDEPVRLTSELVLTIDASVVEQFQADLKTLEHGIRFGGRP